MRSDGNLRCADSKLFDYFLMAGQSLRGKYDFETGAVDFHFQSFGNGQEACFIANICVFCARKIDQRKFALAVLHCRFFVG